MLEPPMLDYNALLEHIRTQFGLPISSIEFLPLGADTNTAVYRALAADQRYFVKLRRGADEQTGIALLTFMHQQGIKHVIAPLPTTNNTSWTPWTDFSVTVYPYVDDVNGYQRAMSAQHWHIFGATFKQIHALMLPPEIVIPHETYDPMARHRLRAVLTEPEAPAPDAAARELLAFFASKRAEILDVIERAERYANMLQTHDLPFVVCHGDAHAGNVLLGDDQRLWIVDWDEPILAPKERDLMFVGGAQGFRGCAAADEERFFYAGYGDVAIDPIALAYYRYERIIQDLAVYYDDLLTSDAGGEDRAQALIYVKSNFQPDGTIAAARRSDPSDSIT